MIAKAEDLDIVMPIYNLLEYSGNISMTLGNLWNYYGEEVNGGENENNGVGNYKAHNSKTKTSKSSEYKTKMIENTSANSNTFDTEVVVVLKNLN